LANSLECDLGKEDAQRASVIFDLDGTLIDSAKDIQWVANTALSKIGVAPISYEEAVSFIGEGAPLFVKKMIAARSVDSSKHDFLLEQFLKFYEGATQFSKPYDNVVKVLETLMLSHDLGICTNKPLKPALKILKHLKLEHFFKCVTGGDNPLGRKPDPRPLLSTSSRVGDGVCIYVGDSEVDAETAKRANVPFLLFSEGYRKTPVEKIPHTYQFSSFDELPEIIDKILKPAI
jgi:phosphoglycolate phosphatase